MTWTSLQHTTSDNVARENVADLSLPFIKGTWFYVDPENGSNLNDGLLLSSPVADLSTAYGLCTSGAGDGIVLLSGGTGTTADTTSYLKYTLAWDKYGITVYGVAAPIAMFGRARISTTTVTTTSSVISQGVNSISRTSGDFTVDGWVVGMQGVTVDSGANNGATFTVTGISALTLTISETFTAQAAATVGSCVMTSYIPSLITMSGKNNTFVNVHMFNGSAHLLSVGCLKVSGGRNAFIGCHFVGAGNATPAASTGAYDVELAAAEECTFKACVFGTDSVIRAAANANLRISGGAWRFQFYDCDFVSYSASATHGQILSASATAWSGFGIFSRCRFMNYTVNGLTTLASLFIGTKPNSGYLLMDSCTLAGFTAWDSVAANNTLYIGNSAAVAAGAGGIATCV